MVAERLDLASVTLCAAASVNLAATQMAMERCLGKVKFGDAILFSDIAPAGLNPAIRCVPIERLGSGQAYSEFVLSGLAGHLRTDHCLFVQWDGFIVDAASWQPGFLDYDYIGAPWPQFASGRDVGNGGFSLRSRRLIEACAEPGFLRGHPEDLAICHENRDWLEAKGMRFAPREVAAHFAFERDRDFAASFGFHGAFNMIEVLGTDAFWDLYCGLDERTSVYHDAALIGRQLAAGHHAIRRRVRLLADLFRYRLSGRRSAN